MTSPIKHDAGTEGRGVDSSQRNKVWAKKIKNKIPSVCMVALKLRKKIIFKTFHST